MIEHSSTVNLALLHLVNLNEKRDQRVTGKVASMYDIIVFSCNGRDFLVYTNMQAICRDLVDNEADI